MSFQTVKEELRFEPTSNVIDLLLISTIMDWIN